MQFPVSDNPARRLLLILEDAKRLPRHLQCIGVWSKVFSFEPEDTVRFYRSINYMNELIDQTEFRIRQIEGINQKLYLRSLPVLRRVVTPVALTEGWEPLLTHLQADALAHLEFCADLLSKSHTDNELTIDQVSALKQHLNDAQKAVSESDLSPEVKTVIFDLLSAIHTSLEFYKIQGIEGVKKAVIYSTGLVRIHAEMLGGVDKTPAIKKVYEVVNSVVAAMKNALQLKQLMGGLDNFIS